MRVFNKYIKALLLLTMATILVACGGGNCPPNYSNAQIEISSVSTIGGVAGNGKSAQSTFEIESTNATSSSLILTYVNIGQVTANNFSINTLSQIPDGYNLVANNCTDINLLANSGNKCTVILSPQNNNLGNKNITLNSSTLSGSWNDTIGINSNQVVLWNTGKSLQDKIYINIFTNNAVATVTMSNDSNGLSSISQTLVNNNFYIVFNLNGDFIINTTYTVTFTNGFTTPNNSCTVTNDNHSCFVEFKAPESVTTRSLFNITTSDGGVIPSTTSLTLDVIVYSYIVNVSGNNYTQCAINADGLKSDTCLSFTPSGIGALSNPSAIAINEKYAYITNYGGNSYTQCLITNQVIDQSSCTTIQPTGIGQLHTPLGISLNNNYAYITDGDNQQYTQCSIINSRINPTSCVTTYPSQGVSFAGITTIANFAFMTNYYYYPDHGNYTQCSINGSGIDSTSCVTVPLYGSAMLSNPLGITSYNGYVYIVNQASNSYTQCLLDGSGIISNSCQTYTPSAPGALNTPNGITISNNYAYIINGNNTYTQCNVDISNGNLLNCLTKAVAQFNQPYGSAIFPTQ